MYDDIDEEGACGETVDHEERTVYEDATLWQGVCTWCGAELETIKVVEQ